MWRVGGKQSNADNSGRCLEKKLQKKKGPNKNQEDSKTYSYQAAQN